jgi:hypothetical protein
LLTFEVYVFSFAKDAMALPDIQWDTLFGSGYFSEESVPLEEMKAWCL